MSVLVVENRHFDEGEIHGLVGFIFYSDSCFDVAILEFFIQCAFNKEILDIDRGSGVEVHVAEDAAEAPHVLAFEVGAVTVAVNLGGEDVFAWLEEFGDVELGGGAGALAVADVLAVDPEAEGGIDAVEGDEYLPFLPVGGDGEGGAVGSDGVFCGDDVGWFAGEGVAGIDIAGHTIALELPVGRDGNGVPIADVEVDFIEIDGALIGLGGPAEFP